MGNGVPLDDLCGVSESTTLVVPHFAILKVNGPVVSAASSPPTYVCGPHAAVCADILRAEGVARVDLVAPAALRIHAVRKLLWASCLWLLCHSETPPLTVAQVHAQRRDLLEDLVAELLPVVTELTEQPADLSEVLTYMEAYSQSMPHAIPSLDLALAEVVDRNAIFYRPQLEQPQPIHTCLLQGHPQAWRTVRETLS
jgi:hypothetical protein